MANLYQLKRWWCPCFFQTWKVSVILYVCNMRTSQRYNVSTKICIK
jgi:hypothetical protein